MSSCFSLVSSSCVAVFFLWATAYLHVCESALALPLTVKVACDNIIVVKFAAHPQQAMANVTSGIAGITVQDNTIERYIEFTIGATAGLSDLSRMEFECENYGRQGFINSVITAADGQQVMTTGAAGSCFEFGSSTGTAQQLVAVSNPAGIWSDVWLSGGSGFGISPSLGSAYMWPSTDGMDPENGFVVAKVNFQCIGVSPPPRFVYRDTGTLMGGNSANAFCLSNFGTSLASIKTAAERSAATALISAGSGGDTWVGLTREGSTDWRYVDGSRCPIDGDAHFCTLVSWWMNTGEDSRCAVINTAGTLNDWECGESIPSHFRTEVLCNFWPACSACIAPAAGAGFYTPDYYNPNPAGVYDVRLNVGEMQSFAYGALFGMVALAVCALALCGALRAWRQQQRKESYRVVSATTANDGV
jgi:hypothetical protein